MPDQQQPIGGKIGTQPGISTNDLKFIQGDILVGMAKRLENFVFFTIKDPQQFRTQLQVLRSQNQITTAEQAKEFRERIKQSSEKLANNAMNIAFSAKGLKALGANVEEINDKLFIQGQFARAETLGDKVSKWDDLFTGQSDKLKGDIHGVMIVVASDPPRLKGAMDNVTKMFQIGQQNAIINIETVEGHVREGGERGHEHFGFKDGITQPMIDGLGETVSDKMDSAPPIDPGVILLGRRGDTDELTPEEMKDLKLTDEKDRIRTRNRPRWALDGSFMVFRKLEQSVPEFNNDMKKFAEPLGITPELLGARLVGRWKSGAPVQNNPTTDPVKKGDIEPAEATSQDFNFVITDQQKSCPFVAHIRKTNPRDDLKSIKILPSQKDLVIPHRILRRGIQYGPELSEDEKKPGALTQTQRGLLFACYQSSIKDGFEFIQNRWVSKPTFPPVREFQPGVDLLLGTPGKKSDRFINITGANSKNPGKPIDLQNNEWVVSKGGEYFFSPGMNALEKAPFA